MQAFSKDNNGIKYLLTVIDISSKFVWIVPLKQKKTGQEVAHAFSKILRERKPCKVWVDKGMEFYNKDVKKLVSVMNKSIYNGLVCFRSNMWGPESMTSPPNL